jgi:hypothetical protein
VCGRAPCTREIVAQHEETGRDLFHAAPCARSFATSEVRPRTPSLR